VSEELSGGDGVFVGSPDAVEADGTYVYEFDEPGYVEEEFVAVPPPSATRPAEFDRSLPPLSLRCRRSRTPRGCIVRAQLDA
jgi:hypothetical protein